MRERWNQLLVLGAAGGAVLTGLAFSFYKESRKSNQFDREIALAQNELQKQKDDRAAMSNQLGGLVAQLAKLQDRIHSQEKDIKELGIEDKDEQQSMAKVIKTVGFFSETADEQVVELEEKALELIHQQESNESLLQQQINNN